MIDEISLLGGIPEFNNPEKYLRAGKMTDHNNQEVQEAAREISGINTEDLVRAIVVYMNKNISMIRNGRDNRKFKRSAEDLMKKYLVNGVMQKYRNGCCDSSTLFVALARAKGISAMQIISVDEDVARKYSGTERKITEGHFLAAVFSSEDGRWYLVDPDKDSAKKKEDVPYKKLDLEDRNLPAYRYGFAYVADFSEVELRGKRIDSVDSMGEIQRGIYQKFDKSFIIRKTTFEELTRRIQECKREKNPIIRRYRLEELRRFVSEQQGDILKLDENEEHSELYKSLEWQRLKTLTAEKLVLIEDEYLEKAIAHYKKRVEELKSKCKEINSDLEVKII